MYRRVCVEETNDPLGDEYIDFRTNNVVNNKDFFVRGRSVKETNCGKFLKFGERDNKGGNTNDNCPKETMSS